MDTEILTMCVLAAASFASAWAIWGSPTSTTPLRRACALPFLILTAVLFPILGGRLFDGLLFLAAAIIVRLRFMPADDIRSLLTANSSTARASAPCDAGEDDR